MPPSTATAAPSSRRECSRRSRTTASRSRTRSIWGSLARIFLLTVAISSIAVFGAAGGVYLEALAAVEDLAPKEQVKLALDQLDIRPANAPANALVIGYDHRPEDGTAPSRSDTVMLLRADPQGDTISMLSFPRDLIVEVRCPNGGRSLARINAAYSFCGVEGTVDTVKGLTGLPIHYIITVNFDGFRKVVDRLNGVWIDVDRRYFNNNKDGGENYAEINLWPGYQRLKGWQALDYVRFRHTDSDLYRVARQQAFVKAVKQAVNASYKPRSVPKIVGAMRNNVEIGQASGEVSRVDARLRTPSSSTAWSPATSTRSRSEASSGRTSSRPTRPTSGPR